MRKEITETAKTVDAAIEAACSKIGQKREDCEFEIIDLPKKSFFGLKVQPAKVRVWIDLPDEKPTKKPEPKREAPPAHAARPEPKQQPRPEPRQQQQPKPAVPRPAEKEAAKPRAEKPREPRPAPEHKEKTGSYGDVAAKELLAKEYVESILKAMKLENEVQIIREDGGICVKITGGGLGVMIGRRGETLDAVQYLTGLVVNRMEGDYMRVTIDCGDYRVKRQETLQELAKRVAGQVLRTDVSKTLEPMNPFERRIIHSTVSEIEGVSSISVGEEPNRRVVITTPTARRPARSDSRGGRDRGGRGRRDDDRSDRGNHGDRSDRGPRGGGRRDDRGSRSTTPRTAQVTPASPKQTPEAATQSPLYTKIDLE